MNHENIINYVYKCHRCKRAYLTAELASKCACPKRIDGDNPMDNENPWMKAERMEAMFHVAAKDAEFWEGKYRDGEKYLEAIDDQFLKLLLFAGVSNLAWVALAAVVYFRGSL